MKILEPQYGADFVGRDYEIHELKRKIRNNGVVVVTGDRGIGKTNLIKILQEFFKKETECYYIESGLLFSEEMNRIFLPEKTKTGFSWSINIPLLGGGGAGESWIPRKPSVLGYMEKSKNKIIFIENAHELKKEERETIFAAIHRNDRLRFVLEIATPNIPDANLNVSPDQVVDLKKLYDEDIELIIGKESSNFSDATVKKIVFLSKGYPYIARSLAYICDKRNTPDEMLEFLETLKDNNIKYFFDQIHKEVLETLGKDAQEVIKKLAIAPPVLTKKLIAAFCGEEIDAALIDINERGILNYDEDFCWIYHPLFRDYLKSPKIQPIAMSKKKEIYCKAIKKAKSEFDSVYILLEVLDEPNIFNFLIEIAENYNAIHSIGKQSYTWGKMDEALLAWSRILKKARDEKRKDYESIATGNIGIIYETRGDFDRALEYHEMALKLNEELGMKEGIAYDLGNIGVVYQNKGDINKSLQYYEKALKLSEELEEKEVIAAQLGNIGTIYGIKGDIDKALEFLEKALKLNEELGVKDGIAYDFGNIGVAYRIKGDFEKSLEYHKRALEIYEELEIKNGVAYELGSIGIVYRFKGNLDKALEYQEKALRMYEELEIKNGIAGQLGNVGTIYTIKRDFDNALKYFEKALNLNEELGMKEGIASQFGNIGIIYQTKGNLDKALEYYA
jgi:tetratricopeptide (TPR) repeat protein